MYKRRTPWRRATAAPVVAALAATGLLAPSAHAGDAPKIAFDKSVWSSSLPDPDSTPGNGQTAEDDYVSIPHFILD